MKIRAVFAAILILGVCVRLFLILRMPLWGDEKSALQWIGMPVSILISGIDILDKAHPPGYYIVLKFWSDMIHSAHYISLRLSNIIFFVTNCVLLFLIGKKVIHRLFGLYAVTAYTFSGYSIIFDWQLKQYSLLVTCILSSLFILTHPISRKSLTAMFLVTYAGLVIDYGYVWYIGSLVLLISGSYISGFGKYAKHYGLYAVSILGACALYAITWIPRMNIQEGIRVIEWNSLYSHYGFVIPFFSGAAHGNSILFGILIMFLSAGMYWVVRNRNLFILGLLLVGIIAFSVASAVNYVFPLLHVRSLQIVGLTVIFLNAVFLYNARQHNGKIPAAVFIALYVVNFYIIVQTHISDPAKLLVSYAP